MSIDYDTFFETFLENKKADFMRLLHTEKSVPKTFVFDTLILRQVVSF